MVIRSILVAALVCLAGCADSAPETNEGPVLVTPEERTSRIRGKADQVQNDSPDTCERYSLYDDGFCDLGCDQVDPDCDEGRPVSESLAWLCELEGESNGYCIPVCGSLDVDCANQPEEEEEEVICDETYDDTDGQCDSTCFPQDDDCVAADDRCFEDLAYGDGTCDEDCAFADPDCGEISASVLTHDERTSCARFPGGEIGRDLATSYCLARAVAEQPACIAACAQLSGSR